MDVGEILLTRYVSLMTRVICFATVLILYENSSDKVIKEKPNYTFPARVTQGGIPEFGATMITFF